MWRVDWLAGWLYKLLHAAQGSMPATTVELHALAERACTNHCCRRRPVCRAWVGEVPGLAPPLQEPQHAFNTYYRQVRWAAMWCCQGRCLRRRAGAATLQWLAAPTACAARACQLGRLTR